MRDETLLIAHGADADGLASAALLLDELRARGRKVALRFVDYHELHPVLQAASNSSYGQIVIADLVLHDASISDELLEALCARREVSLFDHHHLERERLDFLRAHCASFVWSDEGLCTARLVLRHLGRTGKEYRALADAAQGSDYSRSVNDASEKLGAALDRLLRPASGLDAEKLVEILVDGLRGTAPWREGGNLGGALAAAHLRATDALRAPLAALAASFSLHPLIGPDGALLQVACGLADEALHMKEGLRALRRAAEEADLHLVFFTHGVVMVALSPRFEGAAPDVVAFVESRGGGGRGTMGGFHSKEALTAERYPAQRDELLRAIEDFWSTPSKI